MVVCRRPGSDAVMHIHVELSEYCTENEINAQTTNVKPDSSLSAAGCRMPAISGPKWKCQDAHGSATAFQTYIVHVQRTVSESCLLGKTPVSDGFDFYITFLVMVSYVECPAGTAHALAHIYSYRTAY